MFNDKQQKNGRKFPGLGVGAAAIALAVTFSFATNAYAQIQASITKPALRTEYKSAGNINLDGDVDLKNGDRRISVSLRDSDLKQALRMIADKAGLNIIFHSSVSGTVTLDLVNVTLNDAFKMIMQASDLSFIIEKGTLIVMTKDASLKSDIAKQNMMTVPVKYADAAKVADFLNSNIFSTNRPGLSNNKIVVTNPATNELIIFGTKNDYLMAQKVVSKIDIAPRTVSYRVNHTTPKEMAALVCQSLFPTAKQYLDLGDSEDSDNSDSSSSDKSNSSNENAAVTGGAASLGGNSGSSSSSSSIGGSSSSSSSNSDADEISLGEGRLACSIKNNVEANSLKSLDGSSLTVTYFPQKGTINVIGGSDEQAEMIKNFIKANDKKQPQAYVEMQIVELSEEGSKTFDNTWTLLTPFFAGQFDGESTKTYQNTQMFFTGGPYSVTQTTTGSNGQENSKDVTYSRWHGKKTLAWSVEYLINNGKGRLLANPKLMVTNGKKSIINLTSDYVKSTDEEIITAGYGTTTTGVSRTYEIGDDNGISVEMTPFISPDGYVTMNLKPNYATIKPNGEIHSLGNGGGDIIAATLLQRRNLELSNIRIKDGETLVLGGLIQEEESKNVAKIPFLGDLPWIGSIFSSTRTQNTKSELVIMITPHIIKDTEDVALDSEDL